ncbi:hypothetical protein Tco_0783844 [Tanacetum coccineum]
MLLIYYFDIMSFIQALLSGTLLRICHKALLTIIRIHDNDRNNTDNNDEVDFRSQNPHQAIFISFLRDSSSNEGVHAYDSDTDSGTHQTCWSLVVATLVGVAIANPAITQQDKDPLTTCVRKMASLLVKRVASNLLRVRTIASSSHFFSTKGYEFVQHETKDECILKCEDNLGSSVTRGVVNDAFSPHASPTGNLARPLTMSDLRISYVFGTHVFQRWSVVEDEKALYILHDMTAKDIEDVTESVKKFMTAKHENFYEHVPDDKEVKQFVESLHGSPDTVNGNTNASIKLYGVPHKPQADYILVVLGNPQTRTPYGGYAMEIFLDNTAVAIAFIDMSPPDWVVTTMPRLCDDTSSVRASVSRSDAIFYAISVRIHLN